MARRICMFQICDFKQLKYFMVNTMYFYYFSYLFESRPLNRSKWLANLEIVTEFVIKTIILLDTGTVYLHLFYCSFLLLYFILFWGKWTRSIKGGPWARSIYKWSMDPVQNEESMDPWSLFCPHFLGVKGLISIPRKIGSPFSEARHMLCLHSSVYQGKH